MLLSCTAVASAADTRTAPAPAIANSQPIKIVEMYNPDFYQENNYTIADNPFLTLMIVSKYTQCTVTISGLTYVFPAGTDGTFTLGNKNGAALQFPSGRTIHYTIRFDEPNVPYGCILLATQGVYQPVKECK